jgi:lipopolysaccharide transport system ATP-binding protein
MIAPTLREALIARIKTVRGRNGNGAALDELFWALQGVSFEVRPGEIVGIIGPNGAGKSTLLKIISRIIKPSSGEVNIFGRVGSLLEIGTGFHPDLSGRENVFLNGAILGMSRREMRRKFDDIVAFAEVERFIDTPVKYYSTGMYMRLAFAVAAHFEPEVLILDEVLSVGDAAFQRKCLEKMQRVSEQGRTIFFVSHDLMSVRQFCSRALLIDAGRLIADGDVSAVIAGYLERAGIN